MARYVGRQLRGPGWPERVAGGGPALCHPRLSLCARALRKKPAWLLCNGGPAVCGQGPHSRRRILAALEAHLRELIEDCGARYLDAWISALTPFLHGPRAPRANPLYHLGFENSSGATWMIGLAPTVEEIRRRYSETTRQILRKADGASFTLRKAEGSRDLEIYYNLHLEAVRRLESEPEPFEFFQLIFERMLRQNFARTVFFEEGGRVMAANNTARYKQGAFYWAAASMAEKQDYEGRVLLDHQIIQARQSGCIQFEAGQAYVNGEYAPLVRGTSNFCLWGLWAEGGRRFCLAKAANGQSRS